MSIRKCHVELETMNAVCCCVLSLLFISCLWNFCLYNCIGYLSLHTHAQNRSTAQKSLHISKAMKNYADMYIYNSKVTHLDSSSCYLASRTSPCEVLQAPVLIFIASTLKTSGSVEETLCSTTNLEYQTTTTTRRRSTHGKKRQSSMIVSMAIFAMRTQRDPSLAIDRKPIQLIRMDVWILRQRSLAV
jgi:hypothetical protein